MSNIVRLSIILLGLIALAACGGSQPTVLPTAPPAPTQVAVAPSLAPTVAPTIAPTDAPTATTAPTATLAPTDAPTATTAPTATVAPSPTPNLSSENCLACHTDKPKLEEIAVDKTAKSEETQGEG